MKNIYLIETNKASNLIENNRGYALITDKFTQSDLDFIQAKFINIYITNDEQIKYGDFCIDLETNDVFKTFNPYVEWLWSRKIIITNDSDLIKEGVQQISNEFLEWQVENPSCEEVEFEKEHDDTVPYLKMRYVKPYKTIIPSEQSKQLTLKKVALNYAKNELKDRGTESDILICSIDFINGAEYQAKQMYSESEVLQLIQHLKDYTRESEIVLGYDERKPIEFLEIFKSNLKKK